MISTTHSGLEFNIANPDIDTINLYDISTALAKINRFNGHTKVPYSVAEHSVRVSYLLPKHLALAGLFHDAVQTYIGDLASPFKTLLNEFSDIEERIEKLIAKKFNFEYSVLKSHCIKQADLILLATEKRDLLVAGTKPWKIPKDIEPLSKRIEPWGWLNAQHRFIGRYKELASIRHSNLHQSNTSSLENTVTSNAI